MDGIKFLEKDLVVENNALSFPSFGITPTALPDTPMTPLSLFTRN
jgi:hypothetical protein